MYDSPTQEDLLLSPHPRWNSDCQLPNQETGSIPNEDRKAALQSKVDDYVSRGYRVTAKGHFEALLLGTERKRMGAAKTTLAVLTALQVVLDGTRYLVLEVDESGQVIETQSSFYYLFALFRGALTGRFRRQTKQDGA